MRIKLPIVFVCIFFTIACTFAQEAKKDGWWIKVKAKNPEAQTTAFYAGENNHTYGYWMSWNPGDPMEFDVSSDYRNAQSLFILAQTTSGQKTGFCLMYKSKGVRYFEFDLEEGQTSKQSDADKKCEP